MPKMMKRSINPGRENSHNMGIHIVKLVEAIFIQRNPVEPRLKASYLETK